MTTATSGLTQARLQELLSYNPDTGVLVWRVAVSNVKAGAVAGHRSSRPNGRAYIHLRVLGKDYLAHRVIWMYVTGAWPISEIDHQDGDGTNNRWTNLEEATRLKNGKNLSISKRSKTGVTGVAQMDSGNYRASICVDGRRYYLGTYASLTTAAKARKEAERSHGFHAHHGRPRGDLEI